MMNSPVSYIGGLNPIDDQLLCLSNRARILKLDDERIDLSNDYDGWEDDEQIVI